MAQGKTLELKMAKPTKKDFDCVTDFIRGLEQMCEYQMLPGEDDSEEDVPSPTDEEFFKWIQRAWDAQVGCSIFRVVMAGQVAIENACDPLLDYLDFKPELKQAASQRDDLFAACKALLPLVADCICHGMPITPEVAHARNIAVEAVAKAEGRTP